MKSPTRIIPMVSLPLLAFTSVSLFGQSVGNFDSENIVLGASEVRTIEVNRLIESLPLAVTEATQSISLGYSYHGGEADGQLNLLEREYNSHAFEAIYAHTFEGWMLGVAASAQISEVDGEEAGANPPNKGVGTIEGDGFTGALFASTTVENFSIGAVLGIGMASHESERLNDSNSTGKAFADFDTDTFFAALRANYQAKLNDNWTLIPFGTLGYQTTDTDRIVERDAAFRRAIDGFSVDVPFVTLGFELENNLDAFVPDLRLAWWQDLGDSETEIKTRNTPDVAVPFFQAISVPDAYENLLILGANLDGQLGQDNGWFWEIGADIQLSDDATLWGIGFSFDRRF